MHQQRQYAQAIRVRGQGQHCGDQPPQLRGRWPGNPDDGHTLKRALDQVRALSGQCIEEVYVDRGDRGHDEVDSAVYISGQKRGVTDRIRRCMKRRQAIEPSIGHMKHDGWLGSNYLKGTEGDSMNVLLSCARILCRSVFRWMIHPKRGYWVHNTVLVR